ncbi:MAG: ribosome small subunit-dependent GTPase A [Deltaproteobacteria bacterium]|nr:ribosome small subunit-dependent GTPase A [Deltaproteobacteria bacterium]
MVHDLSLLGWSPFFEEQWQQWARPELVPARVAAEHRGAYEVWSLAGEGPARLTGRLRRVLGESALPVAGDWVALSGAPGGGGAITTIERLFARRTAFSRGAAGREARAQVVAANVDRVLVVCGLDADFNPRRIERYLARVWASGAQPTVVLTKADLCADVSAQIAEVEAHCPGAPVLATSAPHGEGIEAVRALVGRGQTAALVGSSGAGKSTLVNALLGEARMATAEVCERDGRGRHTTVHRQLLRLPGEGGLLLDTPGMRELQLLDEAGLAGAFEEVEALAAGCRFGDCGHEGEPGCALRAAVESGELEAERLEHYLQLRREAHAFELRHDERRRRQSDRAFGRMTREVGQLRQRKRGE